MPNPNDPVERIKRIQQRECEKAQAEGRKARVTPIQKRLIESSLSISAQAAEELLFQHTVFCQTVLPYRDPGDEVRTWRREQGQIKLYLKAGEVHNRQTDEMQPVGLPFGAAARLVLCHLNTEALRLGSPTVEIGCSMTAFVQRLQGFAPNGAQIRRFKEQVTRLSASLIRLVAIQDKITVQLNTTIINAMEMWKKNQEEGRLFPSIINLSTEYFNSLQEHAVPLDERAVSALAHSAMALDVYCWLAQRLHRVDRQRGQFVAWASLHEQFGQGYNRIRDFREVFVDVLKLVHSQYPAARFKTDKGGMLLGNSPPPVQRCAILVGKPAPAPAPPLPILNANVLPLSPPDDNDYG